MKFLLALPLGTLMEAPIPTPDPVGLPVPPIVLQGLSYLTLALHLSAMSLVVGGAMILAWVRETKVSGPDGLNHFVEKTLTLGISYTITLGIPPLLFLQVLYGQLFYPSSVLMGALWILVIPLILTVYAMYYYRKLRNSGPGPDIATMAKLPLLLLLAIGFIYVNNLTLAFSPREWMAKYMASPGGMSLNLGEPTFWFRWVLFLSPGLLVISAALSIRSTLLRSWKEDGEAYVAQRLINRAIPLGLMLQLGAAIGMFLRLPDKTVSIILTPGIPMALLVAGVVFVLSGSILLLAGHKGIQLRIPLIASLLLFLGVLSLVALRDQVRLAELEGVFSLSELPVNPQWGMFSLFAGSLLVGLVILVVAHLKVLPGLLVKKSTATPHHAQESEQH